MCGILKIRPPFKELKHGPLVSKSYCTSASSRLRAKEAPLSWENLSATAYLPDCGTVGLHFQAVPVLVLAPLLLAPLLRMLILPWRVFQFSEAFGSGCSGSMCLGPALPLRWSGRLSVPACSRAGRRRASRVLTYLPCPVGDSRASAATMADSTWSEARAMHSTDAFGTAITGLHNSQNSCGALLNILCAALLAVGHLGLLTCIEVEVA